MSLGLCRVGCVHLLADRVRSPETGEAVRVLLSRVRTLAEILEIAESLFRNSIEGGLKIIEYPVKLVLLIVEPVLNRTCRHGLAVTEVIDVFPLHRKMHHRDTRGHVLRDQIKIRTMRRICG